jgi:ABC-2 type transport system permease protein
MQDIWTMMWKEWKDMLFQGGGWRAWLRPLVMIGFLGVYLPLQIGSDWIHPSGTEAFVLLWVPFFLIISFVADAFAGERERHTLETLLASRMSDRAILFGKVGALLAYGWLMLVVTLALGLVLVDLFPASSHPGFYSLDFLLGILSLAVLVDLLAASAGVLVSLRTQTVRQAQQILSIGTLVVVVGGGILLQRLSSSISLSLSDSELFLLIFGVLAVIDVVLLAFALLRFQRAKLILS